MEIFKLSPPIPKINLPITIHQKLLISNPILVTIYPTVINAIKTTVITL